MQVLFQDPKEEPYRAIVKDSLYRLERGKMIMLPVELEGLGVLRGRVDDAVTGKPIDSVRISILGHAVHTDAFGYFLLRIPKEDQQKFQTVHADKPGYKSGTWAQIPLQTNEEAHFQLTPQR